MGRADARAGPRPIGAQEAVAGDDLQRRLSALAAHLVPGGQRTLGLCRLSNGRHRETWAFEAESPWGRTRLVLRREAPASAGEPASQTSPRTGVDVSTEAGLLALVSSAGVPAPRVRLVLQPPHGLGRGFIMDRAAGEPPGPDFLTGERWSVARRCLAYQCGVALARIHAIPHDGLPTLPMAPAQRELERLVAGHAQQGDAGHAWQRSLRWLARHAPTSPASPALVHGDFCVARLLVGEAGLCAVVGWQSAHVGDPMEDLGRLCHATLRPGSSADDLVVGGFGTREQLLAGYEAAGGRPDLDRLGFWQRLGRARRAGPFSTSDTGPLDD